MEATAATNMFFHVMVWGLALFVLKIMRNLLTNIKYINLITKANGIIVTILLILSSSVFYGKKVSIFTIFFVALYSTPLIVIYQVIHSLIQTSALFQKETDAIFQ